ncbi:MAG: S9 family peptidase [Gemmatimonadaceae bacterium]
MRSTLRLVAALLIAPLVAYAQQPAAAPTPPAPAPPSTSRHAITFDDFVALRTVTDPQLSPSGRRILYAVRTADVAANRRTTTTYLAGVDDTTRRAFPDTATPATEARWSPDGRRVAFIAGGQLWVADSVGGGKRQLTTLAGGATGPVWSRAGDRIAFTSAVHPECTDDACNVQQGRSAAERKSRAHVADRLMYRHWMTWDDGTRSHLFAVGVDGTGLRDLTPGATYDTPPAPFGGSEGYTFSPDGKEIAYSAKDAGREDAWSTDVNVYVVPTAGGASEIVTRANRGADENPVYSPDGRFIVYHSQARAGFESDRWRLMMYDRASRTSTELLAKWDRNADAYMFAPDGRTLYVQTVDAARTKLYRVPLDAAGRAASGSVPELVVGEHNSASFSLSADGRSIAFLRDAVDRPAEVYLAAVDGRVAARQVTHVNDAAVGALALQPAEDIWVQQTGGDSIHAFVIKPPHFDPAKRYPGVLLVHGGPQGEWLDSWHGRWNYAMFGAAGFALVVVNPRGSVGYGQKFVDEVSRNWGGKAYADLMTALDGALLRSPWIDRGRLAAAGGSYGGYMVNWIAGHSTRFKALITHAGPYNLENMYAATEELWFPEWEFGGPTWDRASMANQYRVWSPHLFAGRFATPTLVLHGELDFRVPYTEGLSMFTALQRRNVPSRLVVFPDEGHWIAKPENQRLWWREVGGWLEKWLQ